jgi:hypothetical protein
MSDRNFSVGVTRIFMVLHNDVYEQLLLHNELKISQWFRKVVAELVDSENKKSELRRFYRRHSDFFSSPPRKTKQIELHVPLEFPAPLHKLSFYVFGYGNVSLLSRVLLYYYAVKSRWLVPPPLGSTKAVSYPATRTARVIPLASIPDKRNDRRRAALDVDTIFSAFSDTVRDLNAIIRLTELGKAAVIRRLIMESSEGDTPLKIREFYKKKWIQKDSDHLGVVRVRFRISRKIDAILVSLTDKIIGEHNRSLTLRAMIAYWAVKYKVRKP